MKRAAFSAAFATKNLSTVRKTAKRTRAALNKNHRIMITNTLFSSSRSILQEPTSQRHMVNPGSMLAHTVNAVGSSSKTMAFSTSSSSSPLFSSLTTSVSGILTSPGGIVTSVVGVLSFLVYWRYKGEIQRRLKQLQEESWLFGAGVTMKRGDGSAAPSDLPVFSQMKLLEVDPDFRRICEKEGWSIVGLGEYLSTLRPKQLPEGFNTQDLPKLLQQELEAGLAQGMLKALGPNLGRALLPSLGLGAVQGQAQSLASTIATRWFLSSASQRDDRAGLPISILTVLALSENNAKVNSGNNKQQETTKLDEQLPGINLSAMEKFKAGENVKGPTFDDIVPSIGFCLLDDFDNAIQVMEEQLRKEGHCADHQAVELQTAQAEVLESQGLDKLQDCEQSVYDPNDRSMGSPVPINPRLFPDLHFGWGNARSSHTKRQVLKMRLLSLLLNRLGSNYNRLANPQVGESLFTMKLRKDGPVISKPTELIDGIIELGHRIKVVPTSRMTSFGIGMCIKEKGGENGNEWSNVPLAVFLESGYEDKDGNMAPVMMPHSGLRMYISGDGPLSKTDDATTVTNPLTLQHFIGIEGFCGWKSDLVPEVPFNENVESGAAFYDRDCLRAVRLAGLYANLLNGLATDMELPFGGYGVTAVCNDSAAIIQQCLYKTSFIFPLSSIGRYMQRTWRYGQSMTAKLQDAPAMEAEVDDLNALVHAMKELPSDINASPANAKNAAKRLLATMQPRRPLRLMNKSNRIMESILVEEGERQSLSTLS